MKKILVLLFIMVFFVTDVEAKDYTKINTRMVKKSQKFSTSKKFTNSMERINLKTYTQVADIKDPKLLKIAEYKTLTKKQIADKKKSDDAIYKKRHLDLALAKPDNINKRAYKRDYVKLYRIVDRLARANNLAYMNWRIVFKAKPNEFNAFSSDTNCITLYSSVFDTFADNEDALAFIIGHEMGHAMLGHSRRKGEMYKRSSELARLSDAGIVEIISKVKKYSDLKEYRNMEYAADLEGAKILIKAGYDLDKGAEGISFLNTFAQSGAEFRSTHPLTKKRVENIAQNRKYFMEEQWKEWGLYNWYNSEPLSVMLSSDRASIVLGRDGELSQDEYYQPETFEQIYTRYAYKSYIYGEYQDAIGYLNKLIAENPDNFAAYLYASYANEYLYKSTNNVHYLEQARTFAESAKRLAPDNKYVLEQMEEL